MAARGRRVAVVGAGSIGANIAYRLSERGADVTVLDAATPGSGTSAASISWLSTFPQIASSTPAMVAYRRKTDDQFRALVAAVGGEWMHWTGTFTWSRLGDSASRLSRDFAAMVDGGFPLRELSGAQARERDPAIAPPDDTVVYWEEDGGWVDAPGMVVSLLAAARERGAVVHERAAVSRIEKRPDGFVLEAGDHEIRADIVVNAAGSWASHVGAIAGAPIPLDLRPGLVVLSRPLRTPLEHVVNSSTLNIRPDPTGGVAIHWRGEDTYTAHGFNATSVVQTLDAAAEVIPELRGTEAARAVVGIRPVPPGGPIVGWHPSVGGLFVAVSHGGIGWGPQWGEAAAAAIIDGSTSASMTAFSPERFLRS